MPSLSMTDAAPFDAGLAQWQCESFVMIRLEVQALCSAPNLLATWQMRNASPLRGCPFTQARKTVRVRRW